MSKKQGYVNAVEAAKLTGLSEKTIRRKIERSELRAEKRGTSYAIRVGDLDTLTRHQLPPPVLLQRIQELEQNQEHQAEQIAALEQRLQTLEQRLTATRPLIPHRPILVPK